MPQLSLYLDEPTMEHLRMQAAKENVSLSKYVANTLKNQRKSSWPPGFFNLYGSIQDETFVEPPDVSILEEPIETWECS